jgi:hypothetical protein
MTFTYRLTRLRHGCLAACEELALESEGSSPVEAVHALRKAIEQRLTSVEAIGPPSRPPAPPVIELVSRGEPEEQDPDGPGAGPRGD